MESGKRLQELKIMEQREYRICKSNDLIQRARYDLSIGKLKTLAFLMSKIKPDDTIFQEYEFSVQDYFKVMGQESGGRNYEILRNNLKALRDGSVFIKNKDGEEVTVGWLYKLYMNKKEGIVRVQFDHDLQCHIMNLMSSKTPYTQYSFLCVLAMGSEYSFRLYELLRSYAFQHEHTFEINELRVLLSAESYTDYRNFRRRVLDVALREINAYTDIEISMEPVQTGRKVTALQFRIQLRKGMLAVSASRRATEAIDGQYSIEDWLAEQDASAEQID